MSSVSTLLGARRRSLIALGVAAVMALAATSTWQATASSAGDDSTFVPVTPTRILDTRVGIGLDGPFTSGAPRTLTVTGNIPTADGHRTVVPVHANGVVLNVTAVQPSAAGFVSVRPGDATGAPTTSSLNFEAGETTPNAVTVSLPTTGGDAGAIELVYDAYGALGPITEILVDVVGYTTTAGLDAIIADLADKAGASDVYSKSETDAAFVAHGPVWITNGNQFFSSDDGADVEHFPTHSQLTNSSATRWAHLPVTGPVERGGVRYDLTRVEYCITINGLEVSHLEEARVYADDGTIAAADTTERLEILEPECFELVVEPVGAGAYTFAVLIHADSWDPGVKVYSVRSRWEPLD